MTMGLPTEAFVLADFKRQRIAEIEARTEAIFAWGFTYSGVVVPLGARDIIYYTLLSELTSLLTTIVIPASDDLAAPLTLPTLVAIGPFVLAVKDYVRAVYAAEATLKSAVRTATTREAVEAVTDTR